MPELDDLLGSAIQLHRGGRFQQAWEIYQDVLQRDPRNGVALNATGLLLRQTQRYQDALDYLRRAIAVDPTEAAYHANLGEAYRGLNQLYEAIDCYHEAVRLAPNEFVVHLHLGSIYQQAGLHDDAIASFQRAIPLRAGDPSAHYHLAKSYRQQGRNVEAVEAFGKALQIDPEFAEALCGQAAALQALGRRDEALACLQSAVGRRPGFGLAHCNLGSALFGAGRLAEARTHLERAAELEPARPEYQFNLASVLVSEGQLDAAIAAFDRALELQPDYPEAQSGRGTALLARGDFQAGWSDYEVRLRCPNASLTPLPQFQWDGSPLAGRTLLVRGEQALGDALQFVRYLPLVAQQGGKVILSERPALARLLSTAGVGGIATSDQPLPAFDVHIPLLSLPRVLGTSLETVPHDVPYLHAEDDRAAAWREKLAAYQGLKVGIAWQGGTAYRADHLRSIPLACFAPLAGVPGVRLLSLQKGHGAQEIGQLGGSFEVVDLAASLDNDGDAFVDTAAVMKNLDVVISSDTAVAHLAGALGVPVWVALSTAADWRWMRDREDSPWYPTMRLFRQRTLGLWSEVFARMAGELAGLAARR
jgi:tetratricopeptide (TPR) repeat protein